MILKLDLQKAFDHIEWDFTIDTLQNLGLPSRMFSLISRCINSTNISINWNRSLIDSFKLSSGLCHGDPLFPLLFVLYMERLAHLILDSIHNS